MDKPENTKDSLELKGEELAQIDFKSLEAALLNLILQRLSENDICPVNYVSTLSNYLRELSPYIYNLIPNNGWFLERDKREEYRQKMIGDLKQSLSWREE